MSPCPVKPRGCCPSSRKAPAARTVPSTVCAGSSHHAQHTPAFLNCFLRGSDQKSTYKTELKRDCVGHRLPPSSAPRSCLWPWGVSGSPSAAGASGTRLDSLPYPAPLGHGTSDALPAPLLPWLHSSLVCQGTLFGDPKSCSPKRLHALSSNPMGLSCPPGWDLSPGRTGITLHSSAPCRSCRREVGGRDPGPLGCPGMVWGQRGPCSPAVPTAGRKSPCCPPAGTYVCSEAPAPKLLLLICNPLRAGGKGIRGISGLIVTTTIISSGCPGQAARTHAPTGLHTDTDTRTPTPTHTHLCAHKNIPGIQHRTIRVGEDPPRSSKHEYNRSRLRLAGAHSRVQTQTRTPPRVQGLTHGPAHQSTAWHRHTQPVYGHTHTHKCTQLCVCPALHLCARTVALHMWSLHTCAHRNAQNSHTQIQKHTQMHTHAQLHVLPILN